MAHGQSPEPEKGFLLRDTVRRDSLPMRPCSFARLSAKLRIRAPRPAVNRPRRRVPPRRLRLRHPRNLRPAARAAIAVVAARRPAVIFWDRRAVQQPAVNRRLRPHRRLRLLCRNRRPRLRRNRPKHLPILQQPVRKPAAAEVAAEPVAVVGRSSAAGVRRLPRRAVRRQINRRKVHRAAGVPQRAIA